MKVLITDFDRDKKIQAIKGVRAVARATDLKAAKDLIDGPLPAALECHSDLTWEAISSALEVHGVRALCADENASFLQFLAVLPGEMSIWQLRSTLSALRGFTLPGPARSGVSVCDAEIGAS